MLIIEWPYIKNTELKELISEQCEESSNGSFHRLYFDDSNAQIANLLKEEYPDHADAFPISEEDQKDDALEVAVHFWW